MEAIAAKVDILATVLKSFKERMMGLLSHYQLIPPVKTRKANPECKEKRSSHLSGENHDDLFCDAKEKP